MEQAADTTARTELSRAARLEMHLFMRLAREWDLRFETMYLTGALSKWYSSVGNEGFTVPAATALEAGDALLTLHRDSGAILRYYLDPEALFPGLLPESGFPDRRAPAGDSRHLLYRLACQMLGRRDGFSHGVERSYHYAHVDEAGGMIHIGMISHLGAMIPVAAGVAMARRQMGSDRVAINFVGDGATSTGDFHEALNMASVLRLPFVLVIENNQYAFSTPTSQQYACERLADRAAGYGIPGIQLDGNDPERMYAAFMEAVARARSRGGPTLIEAVVGRLRGHSQGDDSLEQVPEGLAERYRREEPVATYEARLLASGACDQAHLDEVERRTKELLIEVIDEAMASGEPDPEAPRPVFATAGSVVGGEPAGGGSGAGTGPADARDPRSGRDGAATAADSEPRLYVEQITAALRDEMRADPAVYVMGQDVAEFGGAFKITEGFLEEFGNDRIFNTPISESATIGMAVGSALLGGRPVIEMQFADFIACGFNQVVNVAAKMHYRTELAVPIVIRLPAGGGVGAGAFHSQNNEALFTHTPGLKVVAPATAEDAYLLLRAAIRDPNPVLYFEHKYLYRRQKAPTPDFEGTTASRDLDARAVIRREGASATIVSYGWMVHRSLEAADRLASEGIECEVIDLRVLAPMDGETIFESVRRTNKVVVVHEATRTGGLGAEIAARIAESAVEWLDGPIRRVAYPDHPVPFQKALEAAALPDPARIADAVRDVVSW